MGRTELLATVQLGLREKEHVLVDVVGDGTYPRRSSVSGMLGGIQFR